MPTLTPDRTHEQRMAGLARANAIRSYRAEVKRNLRAGADPRPMIQAPPPELAGMPARDLVMALPKIGRVKALRLMVSLKIAQSKTLGGLSDRQRAALVEALGGQR